jgi:hypothetical protein
VRANGNGASGAGGWLGRAAPGGISPSPT